MNSFLGAKSDLIRQAYLSVPARSAGISGACKRKRAGDDYGSLSTSDPYSVISKRQKYVYGSDVNTIKRSREGYPQDGSIGEESSGEEGSQSIHSLVGRTMYTHDLVTDKLFSQSYQPASDTKTKPPARCASVSADEAVLSKNSGDSRKGTLNIADRKRYFMYTPDDGIKEKMEQYIHDVYKLFGDLRSEDDCWLHPSPPLACSNGRSPGTIQYNFVWKDSFGKHRLHVNLGMVALISEHQLTEEQMEGYVNKSWHLSHLCGNWTCCNWRHMTVESGRINNSRNQCFRDATHCSHDPQCMKDRKRRLLVTHAISCQIRKAIESTSVVGCQYSTSTTSWYDCGICGKDVLCLGNQRICPSLTSITKSQTALEKLELCIQPSNKVLEAIAYLKQIIRDLIREKEATDAVVLQRSVAQSEVDQSACWSQKQFSSYGQMLGFLLD